ncbi:hypothetical protein SUGI_0618530 [Cryptomeria japonica]|nr:hypothetical protein SUGI_0618530 [Cryptomeria japonica]
MSINKDGVALIAFKTAIVEDPENALGNWNASDESPCSWSGVTCSQIGGNKEGRVVAVNIPKRHLVGIIPSVLGSLLFLRRLNLRHNGFNGSLPLELFQLVSLQTLILNGNFLSGPLPQQVEKLGYLEVLDLSQNSFVGAIPSSINNCNRLRKLLLNNNNFTGTIPGGFGNSLTFLQQLDLSYNLLNGSVPPDLGNLSHLQGTLKLSNNFLSGSVPSSLGNLPEKVSIDLTYNRLSGAIPENGALANQGPTAFVGNPGLCGLPLRKACPSSPPTSTGIPNLPNLTPPHITPSMRTVTKSKTLSKGAILAIVIGDVLGLALISLIFLFCYWRATSCQDKESAKEESSSGGRRLGCLCLRRREGSEAYSENVEQLDLVALDGQVGYDLDELLRASAFVLGKSSVGILYKVVLEDGLTLAVRRLGEGGSQRFKDFQVEVEAIGRVRHPNIVTLRAYYWSVEEKLLIYDYIPNGTLANALHGKSAVTSPLLWAARLKIAKGVAKDFGLGRIASISGALSTRRYVMGGVGHPESKWALEMQSGSVPLVGLAAQGILMSPGSSYQAPEAPKILKPTQKWDVYSFGVILLELLSGKSPTVQVASSEMDLVRWVQVCIEEKKPLPDVLDPSLVEELHREDEILGVLKIALSCVQGSPERRPSMKHVSELLDKVGGPT